MEIASSETRTKYPLSNKKPIKKTVSSSLGLLIGVATIYSMVAIPFNIYFSNKPSTLATVLVFILVYIVLLISQYFYEVLYFKNYYYDCTSEFVVIRKGVVSTREITIPYERIQDVYVDQDVLDRMFGLYDVHISSATVSSGFEAHIDGVEKDGADGLRQLILSSIKSKSQQSLPPTPTIAAAPPIATVVPAAPVTPVVPPVAPTSTLPPLQSL